MQMYDFADLSGFELLLLIVHSLRKKAEIAMFNNALFLGELDMRNTQVALSKLIRECGVCCGLYLFPTVRLRILQQRAFMSNQM